MLLMSATTKVFLSTSPLLDDRSVTPEKKRLGAADMLRCITEPRVFVPNRAGFAPQRAGSTRERDDCGPEPARSTAERAGSATEPSRSASQRARSASGRIKTEQNLHVLIQNVNIASRTERLTPLPALQRSSPRRHRGRPVLLTTIDAPTQRCRRRPTL